MNKAAVVGRRRKTWIQLLQSDPLSNPRHLLGRFRARKVRFVPSLCPHACRCFRCASPSKIDTSALVTYRTQKLANGSTRQMIVVQHDSRIDTFYGGHSAANIHHPKPSVFARPPTMPSPEPKQWKQWGASPPMTPHVGAKPPMTPHVGAKSPQL